MGVLKSQNHCIGSLQNNSTNSTNSTNSSGRSSSSSSTTTTTTATTTTAIATMPSESSDLPRAGAHLSGLNLWKLAVRTVSQHAAPRDA